MSSNLGLKALQTLESLTYRLSFFFRHETSIRTSEDWAKVRRQVRDLQKHNVSSASTFAWAYVWIGSSPMSSASSTMFCNLFLIHLLPPPFLLLIPFFQPSWSRWPLPSSPFSFGRPRSLRSWPPPLWHPPSRGGAIGATLAQAGEPQLICSRCPSKCQVPSGCQLEAVLFGPLFIWHVHIRLGRKGVNFGNSLTGSGVCYMRSKDEDVIKYFWKIIVYLCPTWFEMFVVSHCSKFAMKVDFSSGGCQKLPNWVKITHQNADLLQFVRKIFSLSSEEKNYNLFYSNMAL